MPVHIRFAGIGFMLVYIIVQQHVKMVSYKRIEFIKKEASAPFFCLREKQIFKNESCTA